eukprot:gb/GECG01013622.1/.p1 GENE.gb/GECG01013622.1/~~gb/GECG01013622.1/.p1  ORF type:complete len:541 (+),score=61.57 gb/GECG01013622.1/:1-1623(+)
MIRSVLPYQRYNYAKGVSRTFVASPSSSLSFLSPSVYDAHGDRSKLVEESPRGTSMSSHKHFPCHTRLQRSRSAFHSGATAPELRTCWRQSTQRSGRRCMATKASDPQDPEELSRVTLSEILEYQEDALQKPVGVASCSSGAMVTDAVRVMKSYNVSALLVIEDAKVKGIVSERDCIDKISHGSYPPDNIPVTDIMTPIVIHGEPSTLAIDAVQVMLSRHFRHLPVMTAAMAEDATLSEALSSDGSGEHAAPKESREAMPFENIVGVISLRGVVRGVMRILTAAEDDRKARVEEQQEKEGHATESQEDKEGHELEKPHKIFEKTIEEVLKWQKENGRELLLNARIEDKITVADAVNEMAEQGMSCVAIVDKEGHLQGIFTARDYLFRVVAANIGSPPQDSEVETPKDEKVILQDADEDSTEESEAPRVHEDQFYFTRQPDATKLPVEQVMTTVVKTAKPYWTVAKAANVMLRRNFRHLTVINPDTRQVLGVISLSDLLRVMLMDTESRKVGIHKLSEYLNINLLLGKSKKKETTSEAEKK